MKTFDKLQLCQQFEGGALNYVNLTTHPAHPKAILTLFYFCIQIRANKNAVVCKYVESCK